MDVTFAAPFQRTFPTEDSLAAFAAGFASHLRPGDTVALDGPLGAGKTTFVRAIVHALHGEDQTSSPTFTFWHRYPPTARRASAPPIDHLDLYRIDDPAEVTELGLEEAFDGRSIVLVEWWSKAPHLLPEARYHIDIEGSGDQPRVVRASRVP